MNKKELRNHILLLFLILLAAWCLGSRRNSPEWYHVAGILVLGLTERLMDYTARCFRINRICLYSMDFGIAPILMRFLHFLPEGPKLRTLTLGIFGPFDFLDIGIGIGIVLSFAWFFSTQIKYDLYKKSKTEGMTFREKLGWEWRLSFRICKSIFLPASRWEYDDSMGEIKGKLMPRSLAVFFLAASLCLYLYFPLISSYIGIQRTDKEGSLTEETGATDRHGKTQEKSTPEEAEPGEEEGEYSWMADLENETQRYPLLPELPAGQDAGDYIRLLTTDTVSCKVEPGDTLWGLARLFYGKGVLWNILQKENPGLPCDGALLFPGMELRIPARSCYIKKQEDSRGGLSCASYSYDAPQTFAYGTAEWEPCLDSWFSEAQDSVKVYSHVTKNRMFQGVAGKEAWEEVQEQIKESMEKTTGVLFSGLEFESYYMEDGRRLLFYTFICDNGTKKYRYAVAYVPGDIWLAEFIGKSPLPASPETSVTDICGITRYMAATFEEKSEEVIISSLKYRPYMGYETWPFEELHNPFAIAQYLHAPETEEIFAGKDFVGDDAEVTFSSEEWGHLLYNIVRSYRNMTDEEWTKLQQRPLRQSDLAFITKVELTESPIPGRDRVRLGTGCRTFSAKKSLPHYKLTTLKDLTVFPNLKKLTLEVGGLSDFEALGECRSLTELSIRAEEFPSDLSFLKNLTALRSLTLGNSAILRLNAMGYEREEGSTFGKAEGQASVEKGKLEETLAACTSLTYLSLEYSGELDLDFLTKLPNLYTFRLEPDNGVGKKEEKRDGTSIGCPQIKCLVIDGTWIRNPE